MWEKRPEKVGLAGAVSNFFYHYLEFRGRSSRSEWAYMWLFSGIVFIILIFLLSISEELGSVVFGLYFFATIVPHLSLTVRRLRDAGYSPFWIFFSLVPFVGGITVFVLCLFDSAYPAEFNFYGSDSEDSAGQRDVEEVAQELGKLQELHDRGLIDDDQLKAAKNKALGI